LDAALASSIVQIRIGGRDAGRPYEPESWIKLDTNIRASWRWVGLRDSRRYPQPFVYPFCMMLPSTNSCFAAIQPGWMFTINAKRFHLPGGRAIWAEKIAIKCVAQRSNDLAAEPSRHG
jgi:hypothetical protein